MKSKLILASIFLTLTAAACAPSAPEVKKIPITTVSDQALKDFKQGRELQQNLRIPQSRSYFEKAVSADPNFASAHLSLALAQPTAKGFFESLQKAVAASDQVSDGERWAILAFEAGVHGQPAKQLEYLGQLIEAYPDDERSHNLLGNYHNGQQDFEAAVAEYKAAVALAPSFPPPYNSMGYAYRSLGNYQQAGQAFQKYIELIPDDPNPYDSYAELLLKMGKFDESIKSYQQALSIDPTFTASHVGIATNLMLQGQHDQARSQMQQVIESAADEGIKRRALFVATAIDVDQGKLEDALEKLDRQYAMGEAIQDPAAMAGDLISKGNLACESGRSQDAQGFYEQSLTLIEDSNLSPPIKANARLGHHYNLARAALAKGDFEAAAAEAQQFRSGVEATGNPNQVRQAHELAGLIALGQEKYDTATQELTQANQQSAYVLYHLALAYQGQGDSEKASQNCRAAADFNSLPNLRNALIRQKAKDMAAALSAQ